MHRQRECVIPAVLAVALLAVVEASAQPTFTNVTNFAGLTHLNNSGVNATDEGYQTAGAAAGDVDGDGLVDLFFTRLDGPDVLYRNLGNGQFSDVSAASGFTQTHRTSGATFGDIDNDGDLDLYLTSIRDLRFYLYINDGSGGFTEEGLFRGDAHVANAQNRSAFGVAMGDYDRDGYLDIATSDWGNQAVHSQARLLRNRGAAQPGHFDDVTVAAGLDVYPTQNTHRFTPRFTDLDRDGHTDLIWTGDFITSQLFWNDGDNTFTDGTAAAGVGLDRNGMGTTVGDIDRDGDLDWFVTAIAEVPNPVNPFVYGGSKLYVNNGDRTFTDGTEDAGLYDAGWGWGAQFFDFDNDGDLDAAATNGWENGDYDNDTTRLWENDGAGVFTEIGGVSGVTDDDLGRGLLHLDYDNDGDLDLLIVNHPGQPVLYRNDTVNTNRFLRVETEGTVSNRDGVGAWIEVIEDLTQLGDKQVWEVEAGNTYVAQSEMTAHFGLGGAAVVDLVKVTWPSGLIDYFYDVPADTTLAAVEGAAPNPPGDFDLDGDVDLDDFNLLAANFGSGGALPGDGDADRDGDVDLDDFNLLAAAFGYGSSEGLPLSLPEPGFAIVFVVLANRPRRVRL